MPRSTEAASIEPDSVASPSETSTSGTPPVTVIIPADGTRSDFTTMRFTVLPSGCVTAWIGLVKHDWSGDLASVSIAHAPATLSSFACAVTLAISARLTFDGWKGKAAAAPSPPASAGPLASELSLPASTGAATSAALSSTLPESTLAPASLPASLELEPEDDEEHAVRRASPPVMSRQEFAFDASMYSLLMVMSFRSSRP